MRGVRRSSGLGIASLGIASLALATTACARALPTAAPPTARNSGSPSADERATGTVSDPGLASLHSLPILRFAPSATPVDFALGAASTAGPLATTPTPEPATPGPRITPPQPLPTTTSGWERNPSPDGAWIALLGTSDAVEFEGTSSWSGYYRGIRFVSQREPITHSVLATWTQTGVPSLEPTLIGWSEDGRYAFFFERAAACCCPHVDAGRDLQRINLATGEVNLLSDEVSAARMAPGADALAYVAAAYPSGGRIEILDLATGAVLASDSFAGLMRDLVWAPSGTSLVAVVQTSPCENPDGVQSTALSIQRATGETTQLLPASLDEVTVLRWVGSTAVEIEVGDGTPVVVDVAPASP